jgi:hypothetical protein
MGGGFPPGHALGNLCNFPLMAQPLEGEWALFSPHLFWDVDRNALELPTHGPYVLSQVVEYGMQEDWDRLVAAVDRAQLKEWAVSIRSLDPVSLAFLAHFFEIDRSEFRCYTSKPSPTDFWKS